MNTILILGESIESCDKVQQSKQSYQVLESLYEKKENHITLETKYYSALFQIEKNIFSQIKESPCDCIIYINPDQLQDFGQSLEIVINLERKSISFDRLVECINLDLDQKIEYKKNSLLQEEKQSESQRFQEVLECNSWRHMKMKNQKSQIKGSSDVISNKDKEQHKDLEKKVLGTEVDCDDNMEDFTHLIQEMKLIKELPDEQRKDNAAKMMQKLMQFMGEDEDDEDM